MTGSNFMESSPFLLLFLLGYCLAMIEGELRCYCNESGCVATGYMCKSSAAKCFTAVDIRDEVTHLTHGCLENLSKEHQSSCRVSVDVISASSADWASGHFPLLLCCTEHMCNYRENVDVSVIFSSKQNGTFQRGREPASQDNAIYSRNHRNSRDEDRELWFKAAVIAVPISGGVILVLLVLLAVRMLRSDSRHHRRLIQIRQDRGLTKAHTYISEHFSNGSEKQPQCSLFIEKQQQCSLFSEKPQQCSLFNEKTNRSCLPLFSDTAVTNSNEGNHRSGTTNSNEGNHRSGTTNRPSFFSNASNNYCGNSLPNSDTPNSDTPNSDRPNSDTPNSDTPNSDTTSPLSTNSTAHVSTHESSNHSNPSHATCSTNSDICSYASAHTNPCSFHSDSPAKSSSLTRDTIVKLNKNGQTFSHATKLASNGTFFEPGHPLPLVSTRETTCQNGLAIVGYQSVLQ